MGADRRRLVDARLVLMTAGFALAASTAHAQRDDADERGCVYHVVRGDFMIHVVETAPPTDSIDAPARDVVVHVAPRPTRAAIARSMIVAVLTAGWWVPAPSTKRGQVASLQLLRDGGALVPASATVGPAQGGVYRYSANGFRVNRDGSLPLLEVLVRSAHGDDARVTLDPRAVRAIARRASPTTTAGR